MDVHRKQNPAEAITCHMPISDLMPVRSLFDITPGSKGASMTRHIHKIPALALIMISLILLTSCLSMGERAVGELNEGNYLPAARYAFEALKEEPEDPAIRSVLEQSYSLANSEWNALIEQALMQEEPQRQEQALALYR